MLLHAERIYLRALEPSDATTLLVWENDVKYWHVSGTEIPFSLHAIQTYIAQAQDFRQTGQLRLMICLKDTNQAIGCIDLFDADFKNRRAGVGILIADETLKGQGYALESLNALIDYAMHVFDFKQLYSHVSIRNEASMRLFEKAGFSVSGELINWWKTREDFENVRIYQLIF